MSINRIRFCLLDVVYHRLMGKGTVIGLPISKLLVEVRWESGKTELVARSALRHNKDRRRPVDEVRHRMSNKIIALKRENQRLRGLLLARAAT